MTPMQKQIARPWHWTGTSWLSGAEAMRRVHFRMAVALYGWEAVLSPEAKKYRGEDENEVVPRWT